MYHETASSLTVSLCHTDQIRVESPEPIRVGPLVRLLEDRGAEVSEARKVRPSLEDLFVEVTGLEAAAMKKEKEKAVALMLAKTGGAILFGIANAFVPVIMAAFLTDFAEVNWLTLIPAIVLIAISSTFLGLFVAVSVKEVFEAQTFSNFFRFPMLFLCGLFLPVEPLPVWLQLLSYILPLTYGADLLHGSIHRPTHMPLVLDFGLLAAFCVILFAVSLRNIRRRWIT